MGPVERDTPAPNNGELLVFFVRRDTKCAECAQELYSGNMITLDRQRGALCLVCADLDHLEFLPSGDAAVTRRASKYSRLKAVVLQWSRTRQRYERQGILVEAEAIEQAEKECLADADQRRRKAERQLSAQLNSIRSSWLISQKRFESISRNVRPKRRLRLQSMLVASIADALAARPQQRSSMREPLGSQSRQQFGIASRTTTFCFSGGWIVMRPVR
jgi:hypothetical protein